jgi:putative SOS response-associated peptidase YedK
MASWSEVVAFSQPLTADRGLSGANDEAVTLKVMGAVNVIVWDEEEKRRKVVPMRWGFPHPKNWRIPQPIHARSETMDELKTFKAPFLSGKRGIVLMRTFNEGKQVTPSKTEQWTIDPVPAHMTGAAFIFDSFSAPDLPAPFLARVLVTVPAIPHISGTVSLRSPMNSGSRHVPNDNLSWRSPTLGSSGCWEGSRNRPTSGPGPTPRR